MIRSTNILISLLFFILASACNNGGGSGSSPPAIVDLESLQIVDANLDQVFQADQTDYTATVGYLATSVRIQAVAVAVDATIRVNGTVVDTYGLSQPVDLVEAADTLVNVVVAHNGGSKTYNLTVTRQAAATFAEQAYIKASNTGDNDDFAYSVALSGDTLAVGAYLEDSDLTNIDIAPDNATTGDLAADAGAVYIFERTGGIWIQQAYIKASNAESGDNFGHSVALSGDTLAVGAPGEDSSTTGVNSIADELAGNAGAVYVYTREAGSWSEQAYIKASNTGGSDEFGFSVAVSGDTLAVGAINEDSSTTGINTAADELASNSGAVYVFTRDESGWSEQAYIKASNAGALDNFGFSVALDADTLAAGAYKEASSTTGINSIPDNSASSAGAVYVFARDASGWSEQAYIKASNTQMFDYFGYSLALSGDTLAVGAYLEDSSTTGINTIPDESGGDSGAVYVFTRSDSTWTQQAYIKASNTGKTDLFGFSVALSGDVLVVGAYQEDSNTTGVNAAQTGNAKDSGAVYTFTRNGIDWSEQMFIKPSNTGSEDEFGRSVAVSGDTLALGAHFEDSSTTGIGSIADDLGVNSGAVYVFE